MRRRTFLASALLAASPGALPAPVYPAVERGRTLAFPRDHGSHPAFRTEWWYVTAWLRARGGRELGAQVTFFRSRPGVAEQGASAFAPRQLVFAHAAIADPSLGRLRHDQRVARAAFDLAGADEATTRVWIGDWSLALSGDRYVARVAARDFALDLAFAATQPLLLEGDGGYSRKGPREAQASYYYSRPQLAASGNLLVDGRTLAVDGRAWLDHEWSSELLAPGAVGWDWIGINLADGGALMAFRIRDANGGTLWAGGATRAASGIDTTLAPDAIGFTPTRWWASPRTGIRYPVAFDVRAGETACSLAPLMDDQELDSRRSTGTVYWEGAVRAMRDGEAIGRGYLELTGYGGRLRI
ncbi:MAG: carotenoid 1,2-hydratase [Solirubrobacterales bacterium]|nr:carotenoid 1,2-hydratase [Solirubrobacterales bacterium]